jgi:DAK2 domain fusion protein YloV
LAGAQLRGLFDAASAWLDRNAPAINAINVFPVPDGDTGSNMAATLRDTLSAISSGERSAGEFTAALARNALMSARGNSGVILSQILRGFAAATAGMEQVDGRGMSQALLEGSRTAYAALEHPVEGTILTVSRAAAEAAETVRASDPRAVLEAALAGARNALAKTPELLPELKRAGVVDSGGYGLVVMLEGAVRFLRGEAEPAETHAIEAPTERWLQEAAADHGADSPYGYCTEFVADCAGADVVATRERVERLGDSVLVVGDDAVVRVHVHTDDPGAAISFGTSLGPLVRVKVENMQAQHERFAGAARAAHAPGEAAADAEPQKTLAIAVIAVASGDGFAQVMRSIGATAIVSGGQTMNPNVEALLRAVEAAPAPDVLVLPNNRNVVLSAEQAARLANKRVQVVKTVSMPQGIGALLAFDADTDIDVNADVMARAAASVRTIEVTRAARATLLEGAEVPEGRPIALIDDRLELAAATAAEALLDAVERVAPQPGAAVTLYYGSDTTAEAAEAAARRLAERFPESEVQVLDGGQPFYDFIAAVE